jgi:hypothetical protein
MDSFDQLTHSNMLEVHLPSTNVVNDTKRFGKCRNQDIYIYI